MRRGSEVRITPTDDGLYPVLRGDIRGALALADTAIARAALVGQRRAEMIGHHSAFFRRHALMEFDVVARHSEVALNLAQQLGARRFETEALAFRAELYCRAGAARRSRVARFAVGAAQ